MSEPIDPAASAPAQAADVPEKKCQRIGKRFAVYCLGMSEALKGQTEEGKGLGEMQGFVDGAPDVWLLGVTYRPKARAQGLVLNLCPWCGESLRWWPTVVEEHATEEQ